jgi:hypothetical protein
VSKTPAAEAELPLSVRTSAGRLVKLCQIGKQNKLTLKAFFSKRECNLHTCGRVLAAWVRFQLNDAAGAVVSQETLNDLSIGRARDLQQCGLLAGSDRREAAAPQSDCPNDTRRSDVALVAFRSAWDKTAQLVLFPFLI